MPKGLHNTEPPAGTSAPTPNIPAPHIYVERFRTVVNESLLDRGTARRVVILEYAFERKNMLLLGRPFRQSRPLLSCRWAGWFWVTANHALSA